jgi:CheY-like chemotaxis protein
MTALPPAGPAAPLTAVHLLRARALMAEDNTVNQKLAVRTLEKLGCRVDVAAGGQEAIDMLAMLPSDVVFRDCEMRELDSSAATREIRRRDGSNRHTPIIAMTAQAMAGDREKCLGAGMDDYISKPVHMVNLEEALTRGISPGSLEAAPPAGQDTTRV